MRLACATSRRSRAKPVDSTACAMGRAAEDEGGRGSERAAAREEGSRLVAGAMYMHNTSERVIGHAAVERAEVPKQQAACRACRHDHLPHGHRVVLQPEARPSTRHRRRVPAQGQA